MPRRSLTDDAWANLVVERYIRRRDRVQQREKAIADLKRDLIAVLEPPLKRFADWMVSMQESMRR